MQSIKHYTIATCTIFYIAIVAPLLGFTANTYAMRSIPSRLWSIDEKRAPKNNVVSKEKQIIEERLKLYADRLSHEITPFISTLDLVQIISGYIVPTDDEIERANNKLEAAVNVNNLEDATNALTSFAYKQLYDDYLANTIDTDPSPEILDLLLAHNANPNASTLGVSLLHRVNNVQLVEVLIRYGADINAVDQHNRNVLYSTWRDQLHLKKISAEDQYTLAKTLILCKANPDHRNKENETPLHYSATKCRSGYVRALLECSADIHAIDDEDNTALHRVTSPTNMHMFTVETSEIIRLLTKAKADPLAENKRKKSVLDQCSSSLELQALITEFQDQHTNKKEEK